MKRIPTKSYREISNWNDLIDSKCGKGNIIPHEGTVSKNRGVMFSSASTQYRPIVDGEAPLVDTKYSYDILTSSMNVKVDREMRVIAKIPKILHGIETGVVSYILYDEELNTYHYIKFSPYSETGAGYGVKMENSIPEVNGIIPKDEYIIHTHTYKDDMVPHWGINALTVLAIDIKTVEDAGMISENLANRFQGWTYNKVQKYIDINNDVLKNVYGTASVYKPFPFIGEEIENDLLMAMSNNQKNHQFIKTGYGFSSVNKIDDKVFAKGKVVDITVRQKVGETCNNSYLNVLIQENREYELKIYEIMKDLKLTDASFTQDFEDQYYLLRAFYEHKAGFRHKGIKPNSSVQLEIVTVNEEVPTCGQKITGRCGNKFTTASIYPDGKYYTKEFGNIDYVGNCLALFNRAIMLVPIEMYQTYISLIISNAIIEKKYPDNEMKEIILTVLKIMDKDMYEVYYELFQTEWESFKEYPLIEWIQSTYHSGTTIESCYNARNYLNSKGLKVQRTKVYTTNSQGEEVELGEAFVSKLFITPLKQVADTQLSVRAVGSYDTRGIIIRDDAARLRNTPVRKSVLVGDIQANSLHPDDLAYLNSMTEQESAQVITSIFNAMGVELKNVEL